MASMPPTAAADVAVAAEPPDAAALAPAEAAGADAGGAALAGAELALGLEPELLQAPTSTVITANAANPRDPLIRTMGSSYRGVPPLRRTGRVTASTPYLAASSPHHQGLPSTIGAGRQCSTLASDTADRGGPERSLRAGFKGCATGLSGGLESERRRPSDAGVPGLPGWTFPSCVRRTAGA